MKTNPNRKLLPAAVPMKVSDLYLDPANPRLAEHALTLDDQTQIAKFLWKEMRVNELVDSIASGGYWQHEEIFAARERGKLVVIEGNRRVTAVKLLTDESLAHAVGVTAIPSLSSAAKEALKKLPVVLCSRQAIWEYESFKHVNGPQEWESIAKAQYIARVHNKYRVPLETFAKAIGDRNDTIRRLYRGLMVLEQAEREGVFSREDRWAKRFAYSHLWTGLGYAGIQAFIGISLDRAFKPNPVPQKHLHDLGDLLLWMYGSKSRNRRPVIQSQNPDLRILDEALRSKDGAAALRAGLPLQIALRASQGDERLLREALVKAEAALKDASGLVPNGFKKQKDLQELAGKIATIAERICDQIEASMTRPAARDHRAGRMAR